MIKQLHVINGDGTLGGFQESGIAGDVLVWREMLMEGPLSPVFDDAFYKSRSEYLSSYVPGSDHSNFYEESVRPEIIRLAQATDYDEIILWFEYDLFCQVNLWACLSILEHYEGRVSLVCPTDHPEIESFKGMGQLKPDHFEPLFENRVLLDNHDLQTGRTLWKTYCQGDLENLKNTKVSSALSASIPAIQAHLDRFKKQDELLSKLEIFLLKPLLDSNMSRRDLLVSFLQRDLSWGMGDIQVNHLIDSVSSHFDQSEPIQLKPEIRRFLKSMDK